MEVLTEIQRIYNNKGVDGLRDFTPGNSINAFYVAILFFGAGDIDSALRFAGDAALKEENPLLKQLYSQAAVYLKNILQHGKQDVYVTNRGFASFIRGGGNVPLYKKVSAALRSVYSDYQSFSLLDIGVGEGMAFLPAITQTVERNGGCPVTQLDLLEPSQPALDGLTEALGRLEIKHNAHCETLRQFTGHCNRQWDLVEATFSLQSIPDEERLDMLKWIRQRTGRLVLVEFDVPDFNNMYEPERFSYFIQRYGQGLAEYGEDDAAAVQEFLMPVFFGYFDASAHRTNYEQSIERWKNQLAAAGFKKNVSHELFDYWWAPAYIIDAC